MEVRCRRCNSTNIHLRDSKFSFESIGEKIENVIGKVKIIKKSSKIRSPGQLPKHYAPRTPLKIIEGKTKIENVANAGFLSFRKPKKKLSYRMVKVLSSKGDLCEAAANFFSSLHELDDENLDAIYAEPLPEVGLGRAIMDRMRRAEASH